MVTVYTKVLIFCEQLVNALAKNILAMNKTNTTFIHICSYSF